MNKKKAFAAVMASLMTASVLAGCGGSGSSSGAASTAASGSGTSSSDEQINLRFVSWQTDYMDLNEAVAEAYTKEHPNITVTFDYYGDMTATEYYKKVDLMVMGGEEMDILMTSAFPEHAQRAGSGAYLPLDEYFEAEGVVPEEAYSEGGRQDLRHPRRPEVLVRAHQQGHARRSRPGSAQPRLDLGRLP